jgi:predicted RNA binding protein with dsRBD fold (UPF0201 family)
VFEETLKYHEQSLDAAQKALSAFEEQNKVKDGVKMVFKQSALNTEDYKMYNYLKKKINQTERIIAKIHQGNRMYIS